MSPVHPMFAGSKRAARTNRLETRESRRFRKRLRKLRLLALRLTSKYELDVYLRDIPDMEVREAARKLILTYRPDLKWR